MIARNGKPLNSRKPRVFPISLFEVDAKVNVPLTKTELQAMLANKTAIPFHKYVCPNCHNIPQGQQWMNKEETSRKLFSKSPMKFYTLTLEGRSLWRDELVR